MRHTLSTQARAPVAIPVKLLYHLAPLLALSAPLSCAAPPPPSLRAPAVVIAAPGATAAPGPAPAPMATAAYAKHPPQPLGPCERGATVDITKMSAQVPGSFSSPGLDEIAGELQCEDFGLGGYALVRRVGDHFELVRIAPRVDFRTNRNECRALRTSSGRDLLICREDSIAYGQHDQAVVAIDYARDEENDIMRLVSVSDTTDTSCNGGPDVVAAELEGYAIIDLDGDGALDVRVTVRAAKARVPPRPACVMGSLGSGDPPKVPRPPRQIVELLARGGVLTPTPASARVLTALAALDR